MVNFDDYVAGNVRGFMAEVLYWRGLLPGEPYPGVYFIVSTAEVVVFLLYLLIGLLLDSNSLIIVANGIP